MKRFAMVGLVVLIGLCLAGNVFAESATKDECVAKSKEAAQMVKDKGLDAAKEEISKKDGAFVWKDTYVFMMDTDGVMLAHPMKASLVGTNMMETKDSKGKLFFQEFATVAKESGEGWVDYMWPKPGATEDSEKTSYILLVPDTNVMVGAGIYK